MVDWSTQLHDQAISEWLSQYIEYRTLKILVKRIAPKVSIEKKKVNAPGRLLKIGTEWAEGLLNHLEMGTTIAVSENKDAKDAASNDGSDSDAPENSATLRHRVYTSPIGNAVHFIDNKVSVPNSSPAAAEERAYFFKLQTELDKVMNFYNDMLAKFLKSFAALGKLCTSKKMSASDADKDMRELYRGLLMLVSYCETNKTTVTKISKKHDKSSMIQSRDVVVDYVAGLPWGTMVELRRLIGECEVMYVTALYNGDRKRGLAKLRDIYRSDYWDVFLVGLLTGLSVALAIALVVVVSLFPEVTTEPFFFGTFPLFRGVGLITFHLWLWSGNMGFCRAYKINSRLILGIDPRKQEVTSYQVARFASLLSLYTLASMLGFILTWGQKQSGRWPDAEPGYIPMTLFVVLVATVFCPFPIFFRSTRWYLMKTWFRIITSPFSAVEFKDFFNADHITSSVIVMGDLVYSTCYLSSREFLSAEGDGEYCAEQLETARFVLAFLPYWFRLAQCINRLYITREPKHFWNGGKYTAALAVTALNLVQSNTEGLGWDIAWVLVAIFGTGYAFYWDVVHDFGLFKQNAAGKTVIKTASTLPSRLQWVYKYLIASNLLMRVAWILTISPGSFGISMKAEFFVFILGAVEVFRRNQWSFFRLENEHMNNCGQFRAVNLHSLDVLYDELNDPKGIKEVMEIASDNDTDDIESARGPDLRVQVNCDVKDEGGGNTATVHPEVSLQAAAPNV